MATPKGQNTRTPFDKGVETRAPTPKPSLKPSVAAKPKRLIKVSKTSSALRQHVAGLKDFEPDFVFDGRDAAPLMIEIKRLAPPAKVQKRSGPSPELRRMVEKTKAAARLTLARPSRPAPDVVTIRGPGPSAIRTRGLVRASLADPADLGALVRSQRRQKRLSQGELAALSGVGRRFIVELEAGKATVELGKALKVCAALSLSLIAESSDHE
jgi:y4mF family transcriptional regulator